MAATATKIADVIQPEVFNDYVIERTAELAELTLGGIISTSDELTALANSGGKTIQMPFWTDLDGAVEVLSDSASLTVGKIGSGKDEAHIDARGRAWGVNDLAKALSGSDPMRAIGDLVAGYWNRKAQATLVSKLSGVFAVAGNSDMIVDVSIADGDNAAAANLISSDAVIDAAGTMGDAAAKITGIAMHSVVYQKLQKAEVIQYIQPAGASIQVPTYLGLKVIVDDGCPRVAGGTSGYVYTSYLFGEGAIGFANGAAPVPVETDRDSLGGEDILITRRHFLLHPRGVKFASAGGGAIAGEFPTNAELALAAKWSRVYERKNVRLAQLLTNG